MRREAPPALSAKAALLLAAGALLFCSCSTFFQGSVPQRNGVLAVPGLTAPVEIVRDRFGIPHIHAKNDHDLLFAQGFAHAQDRLFQMDLDRRLARGELAELFGGKALPADRLFRHLGLASRAPALFAEWPAKTREMVQAYCDGVNAGMASLRAWPVEFRLLDAVPRRWTPEDVAAGALLKSFGLAQWIEEPILYRIALRLSPEKFAELFPQVPPGLPVIVPGSGPAAMLPLPPSVLTEGIASLRLTVGDFPRSGGSNGWAVSGKKSVTGLPLLANDPHMILPCPSLWYEVQLTAPGVDVYGVSFPGAPGVVIGHNPRIAWGLTSAMLDDADFFIERIEGDRVMFRKKWVPVARRVETIRVKDGKDEVLTVLETPHGPILSPVLPGISSALSFHWVGYDGGDPVGALHALDRARNREEFLAAVSGFPHPAQNIVYADVEGNIGVVLAGRIPVRKGGSTLLPVPGDTGEWDWKGFLPFSENPRVWNPPGQIVAAANFAPAGTSFRHYLSRLYEPPDRGKRILRMLGAKEKFSAEAFGRMQADVLLPDAEKAVSLAVQVAKKREAESPAFREAARILSEWDLSAGAGSRCALLFEVFYEKLIENVFRDELGDELYAEFTRSSRLAWNAMDRVIENGDSLFFVNAATGRKDSLDDLVARSLFSAMSFLKDRLGSATSTWMWGRLHQLTLEHPFGKKRYLQRWFNIGPNAVGGDGKTVFKEEFRHGTDFQVLVGPAMRQVVPLGDRRHARSVITTGASGHFFERHYRDQTPLWLSGKTHPAWTAPEDVESNREARLELVPK
ncbi:MAG TPA: penicillin acylase family protein [Candidatus Deferrimicrobiaceae bacterium]|nr:penicillin acylase family protein [Candidatus Deferrimicrobiaceae bacterium]